MLRDAGLVDSLLGIATQEQLLGHPVIGHSGEKFVSETLIGVVPAGTEASFYRTEAGAEIDRLLSHLGGEIWTIEITRSSSPTVEKGFHSACAFLKPKYGFIVYPGEERFPLGKEMEAIRLRALAQFLRRAR